MKPFNKEEALKTKQAITRDGRDVTQLVEFNINNRNVLYGVVNDILCIWTHFGGFEANHESDLDLFMKPIKKEGWVNVYSSIIEGSISMYVGSEIFKTKEAAIGDHRDIIKIDTVKIEWEE